MPKDKLQKDIQILYDPPLTDWEAFEAIYNLIGFFETLLEIERENDSSSS